MNTFKKIKTATCIPIICVLLLCFIALIVESLWLLLQRLAGGIILVFAIRAVNNIYNGTFFSELSEYACPMIKCTVLCFLNTIRNLCEWAEDYLSRETDNASNKSSPKFDLNDPVNKLAEELRRRISKDQLNNNND